MFADILDTGDVWTFSTTVPTATQADLVAAVNVALSNPDKPQGFVIPAQPMSKADAAELDAAVLAKWPTAWAALLVNVRDEASGETPAEWRDSVGTDYLGYYSALGVLRVAAGHGPHVCALTGRTYHRPAVYFAAPTRAANPVHKQWGAWAGDRPLLLADLALVYPIVGGRASSDGPTRSRRHTCRQLGALAERLAGEVPATQAEQRAAIGRAITVWEAIRDRCDPTDPRHRAIAARCEEEIATLRGPDGLGALA